VAADELPQPPVVAQISPAEDPADQPAAGMVLPAELHADVDAVGSNLTFKAVPA
jgi:hypothetical protein